MRERIVTTTAEPMDFVIVICRCGRSMTKDKAPESNEAWPQCHRCLARPQKWADQNSQLFNCVATKIAAAVWIVAWVAVLVIWFGGQQP